MTTNLAPIVLFAYNRPWHTERTLKSLANNVLAKDSVLYIYADGAKEGASEDTLKSIAETREVLKKEQWCKEVYIIEAEYNRGLADSIVGGVTEIINKHGRIIVLEDDIVTSPGFLQYMNDSLSLYEKSDRVMHISAYLPETTGQEKLPETFFLRFMSCWGWATWQGSWKHMITDTEYLHKKIPTLPNVKELNFDGPFSPCLIEQLEDNYTGKIKTWAIKWFMSIFLNDGLCLHPRRSMTENIGWDGLGENCGVLNDFDVKLASSINVEAINIIEENKEGRKYLARFYKYGKNSFKKARFQSDYPNIHKALYSLYKMFKR